jgi:peroxiredoxin
MNDAQMSLIPWSDAVLDLAAAALLAAVAGIVWAVIKWRTPQRRRALLFSLANFVIFVGLGAVNYGLIFFVILPAGRPDRANQPGTRTHIGQAAPNLVLTTTEGSPFHLADLRGRVILVNFFATWCDPCRLELPQLQRLWEEFRGNDDFCMIAVGREESPETVKKFQEEQGLGFPVAADPDGSAFAAFATERIPRTYLIDRKGMIVYQCTGYYEEEMSKLQTLIRRELEKRR